MSYYTFIPLTAFLVHFFIWVYIYARHTRSPVNHAFLTLIGCLGAWVLVDFLTWSRVPREMLPVLLKLVPVFWLIAGLLFMRFVYTYIGRTRDTLFTFTLVVTVAALPVHLLTDWVYTDYEGLFWGTREMMGPLYIPLSITNVVIPCSYSLFLLIRHHRQTSDEDVKRQLRLIIAGSILPLVLGYSEVLLHSAFDLHGFPITGNSFTAVFSLFVYRAVVQYDFLALGPVEAGRQLFDSAEDGILLLNKQRRITMINPVARRLLQIDPDQTGRQTPAFLRDLDGEVDGEEVEVGSGAVQRTLSASQSSIEDAAMERGSLVILRDITGRKRAEQAIRRSEERFRLLFNSGNVAICVFGLNDDGTPSSLIEVNEIVCRHLGYTKEELYQLSPKELMPPDVSEEVIAWAIQSLQNDGHLRLQTEGRTKDGRSIPVEVFAHRFVLDGRPAVLATGRDISERRDAAAKQIRLEEQLGQAQKLEAVGTLAGGIAHDMNNVLGTILSLASILYVELDPDDPRQPDIQEILAACKRGRALTQSLLGFARKGRQALTTISVERRVSDVRELLLRTIPKKIRIQTRVDPDLHPIEGDPDQISHVLMNLSLNAVEAMSEDGVLTITAENLTLDAEEVTPYPQLQPGAYVQVQVSDTGCGMEPKIVERAFEPFFSTKPEGKGTGLGLAMVYGTVTGHGGAVTLESKHGEGTTVTILLPAATDRASDAEVIASAAPGTVLLVDDEEVIRGSGQRLLEALGHKVLLAANGKDALAIYREQKDEIVLVLLDMMMPEMDGEDTFFHLRELDPDVRVLLSSGYMVEDKARRLMTEGARGYIQKPYTLDALAEEMAQALGRAAPVPPWREARPR